MSTVSSDQGRVHAASYLPKLGLAALVRAVVKPLSGFAQRKRLHTFSLAGRDLDRSKSLDHEVSAELLGEDRRRIAADVHDLIMQDLSFALAAARALADDPQAPPQARAVVAAGERALAGAHDVVESLMSRGRQPILGAVEASVRAAARNARVVFHAEALDPAVQPDQATHNALVHIGREAVTNAVKHGGPDADVEVVFEHGEEWRLTVRDQGRGFDPNKAHQGFGIQSMRARADELGGSLRLDSAVGRGSTIEATLP
jgi:signal transduction histidine kinase